MADIETPAAMAPDDLRLRKVWYLFGGLMLLAVSLVSLMPAPEVGVGDKLAHVLTYFFLGGWFGLLARGWRSLAWTVVGLTAFGMLLELLQGLTDYRYAEWGDVFANGGGTLLGILLYFTPLKRLLGLVDRVLARMYVG